jgi:hypothetical protein
MAVPSSGELQLRGYIALEVYGDATGNNISLGTMSDLAGFAEPDSMSDFYGYVSAVAPSVTTNAATSISSSAITLNGNVTSDGDATITQRGFYFGTNSASPTNNTKYTVSGTTGVYSLNRTGLNPSTTYYFWAFATNAVGTTYGTRISQVTSTPFAPSFALYDIVSSKTGVSGIDNCPQSLTYFYYNPDTSSYTQYALLSGIFQGYQTLNWGGFDTKTGNWNSHCTNARNLRRDLATAQADYDYFYRAIGQYDSRLARSGSYSYSSASFSGSSTLVQPPTVFGIVTNSSTLLRWQNKYDESYSFNNATVKSDVYFNYS